MSGYGCSLDPAHPPPPVPFYPLGSAPAWPPDRLATRAKLPVVPVHERGTHVPATRAGSDRTEWIAPYSPNHTKEVVWSISY
jgi:hypothetical protein